MKSVYLTVHFGRTFFYVKPRAFCSAMFFSDLNIKAWNVITIITSLGTRVLIGTPSESQSLDFSDNFVSKNSAQISWHCGEVN